MSDDRVTILIPIRHFHEPFLLAAIASVFAQSRTDWSMLFVVHPSSERDVAPILDSLRHDSRVRVLVERGDTLAGAYNTAMRNAKTAFITVLLGDDLFAPDAVEVLGAAIRSAPEVDFFHSGRYFVNERGERISSNYMPTRPVTRESFIQFSPVKHLLCWRASRGLAAGGVDESLDNFASDDYDFPWTMFEHGAKFQAISSALYIVRDHREAFRLTTHLSRDRQRAGLRRILLKHGVPEAEVRRLVRSASRGYMRQSLFHNRWHQWLLETIGFDPTRGWREGYR